MKEMKRFLSLFLCLAMLVGCLPIGALATENEGVQLETTAPVETVLLTADGEQEDTTKNTEPVVTDPAVTEPVEPKTVVPETTAPVVTVPETTVPETTVPETTVPETTVPETTVPETTVPETTVPEETEPEETEPEETEPEEDAWTRYQEALKRYEQLIAELEASHKLAMEKEAAEKVVKKPSRIPKITGSTSDTAASAVARTTGPIYVLAGGDFQAGDNGKADHYYSRINMGNILDKIKETYPAMDGFIFVGDYDGDTHNDANAATGIAAMMEEVSARYTTLNHDNSILLQGNHESNKVAGIDPTGGYDFDGYAVYVMNQADYCEKQTGKDTQIQTVANNLKAWLNNKLGEGYDAPIFITAHVPLAYGTRTYTNGDGLYAKYVFDVINAAAEDGLNIIFMHGHDHAYGADNYLGGEAIYLAKGDKINIAEPGNNAAWTEETLNFTYMNAGYVGYYNENYYNVNSYEAEKLTMTVFKIENDKVTVERYSKDGLYNLKSAGREGFYSNAGTCAGIGLSYNTTTYTSPQTISLGSVADYGDIGSWVGIEAETPVDDVTPSNKGWVEIIAPVPGIPEIPATPESTKYVYTLDTDGTVTDKANAEQGYLIVGSDNDYAMTDSLGRTGVTITNNAITLDAQPNYEWWITADGKITDGTNYLKFTGSTNWGSPSGSVSVVTNASQANAWEISHDGNGQYTISYDYTYSSWGSNRTAAYYLCYNSNAFSVTSSSNTVRLFSGAEVTTPATEGTPAKPGTNGTYGKVTGTLSCTVEKGVTADEAMAVLQSQIDGYYEAYAMSTPDDSVSGSKIDDSTLTWEWVDKFDGNTAGDYAVKISYNGIELATAEVVVPATTTYYIAEGNGLYIVDMNTNEANAMAAVQAGVTVYSATNANGTNKTPVSDADVTWNWVDTYNGADSGPYTVEILKDGTSLGTVEVKVDVQYETGIETDWTYIGESQGSGGTTTVTYTLDTNGIDTGSSNKYIIVARNQAYLLDAGSARAVTISSDGKTATTNTRDYEYYFTGSTSGLITRDGTNTLYQQNWGIHTGYIEDSNLDRFTNLNNGYYRLYDGDGTARSLYYNESSWTVTNTDHTNSNYSVRLYKFTKEETTGGTPGGTIYAKIEGNTVYTVSQGTTVAEALAAVKAGITGYTSSSADGSNPTEIADSNLTWKWKNTYASMVTGSYWVEISYQGKVLGTVEVKVEPGTVNNYPEYPDEGSVKVSKTGTGIDFQSSGIAQVEVSASGIPMKKGIDVVIMVDTSSSMASWCICGVQNCTSTGTNHQRRNVIFEESLENLIKQLQAEGGDGEPLDIRVAMADFNGFNGYNNSASYGSPYDREENDTTNDTNWYSAANQAKVYTGTKNLTAGAFVQASELSADSATYGFKYVSGTNYDYAFDAIYQLGYNIKEANAENGENRDLYVVFMSDGAPMQYNYYHSQGASTRWQYWLTGTVEENGGFSNVVRCQDHTYYYDEATGNQHRMANAVKGSPSTQYEIIRKSTAGLEAVLTATDEDNMYMIPGLGAKMFSIAFDPAADGNTPASAMTHVLEDIATEQTESTKYYYLADSASDLSNAFTSIGNAIAFAAYNARFVDQMGDDYDLQMETSTYPVVNGTSTTEKTLAPKIEIISYDIYTRQDFLDGTITEDKIGDRKGTYTVLETVTFNADGTEAYSDKKSGNILVNGVINAQTFWYNTTQTAVAIEGVSIPTGVNADNTTTGSTNMLPAETFYWKLGTVQTSELAMRYYVYLTGSMEGTREAGSYPTNEYATLYYDNYLGNPCYKDTVSPVMPWKEANVSYAFYLVNDQGEIVVNQTTGETGSFANKIAVTNPVVFDTVLLNTQEEIDAVEAARVLPDGYTLYDATYNAEGELIAGPVYTVTVNSNTTGGWEISSIKNDNTTYVMNYDPENSKAYSYETKTSDISHDYTHTVVWFAVLWEIQALPDSVVVDYGLPVDISVLTNDMFGKNGKLAGVGAITDSLNLDGHDTTLASGFGANHTGTYGTAKADTTTGKVRYTLNTMQMDGYDKFAYAAQYTGNENAGYYYDTVTVIPATTIYYEDGFLTFSKYNTSNEKIGTWDTEGKQDPNATQDEDRPGQYSLTDANNIYGYDSVNNGMSTFSLGQARKVHVDANSYATAEFTFSGTGFDVISMTSNITGALAVKVTAGEEIKVNGTTIYNVGDTVKAHFVNTYYGYKQVAGDADNDGTIADGEMIWDVDPDASNSLYQVPVIQIENLPYAKYNVLITATYAEYMDKTGAEGYDLYLDAIRIYDPANDGASDGTTDTTIEDAYKADGEGWPSYIELRNKLIDPNNDGILTDGTLGNDNTDTEIIGEVFIDGDGEVKDAQIEDYKNFGPNNEVYLAKNQSVAFLLGNAENAQNIHLGAKSANGVAVTYTIKNIAQNENSETGVKAGQVYNEKINTLDTATDMYYDITGWKNDIIVITNTSGSILSLTNIKATYKSDPNGTVVTSENGDGNIPPVGSQSTSNNEVYAYMTPAAAKLTLRSMNNVVDEPEETLPGESVPDTTVPDASEPEPSESETTTPEESTPETTVPEETVDKQEQLQQAVKETVTKVVKTVKNVLKNLFGKWFR